jgi:hypothetical protein
VFFSNFDFEHQLAGVQRKNAAGLAADLASAWLAVSDPDDCVFGLQGLQSGDFAGLADAGRGLPCGVPSAGGTLVPWGWDESVLDFAVRRELVVQNPPLASVREVNSRGFSFALETELGCGLAGSCCVASRSEFETKASELIEWVAKAEFSMSSRERIVGRGAANETQVNWVENRLREGSAVFIEPWVPIRDEVGVQFEISKAGEVELVGVTGLLTTDKGGFAGCLIGQQTTLDAADIPTARKAARRVADAGYFGPLGIDSANCEVHGEIRRRPLQDINARHTMGRLALGWRDLLGDGETAAWLFLPGNAAAALVDRSGSGDVRVLSTSPVKKTGLKSVLLISKSSGALNEHATEIFRKIGRVIRWPSCDE